MGFESNAIKFLLQAKKNNIPLGKTLTLGRQSHLLNKVDFSKLLAEAGISVEVTTAILQKDPIYIEPFLEIMGATSVHSMDASSYESATFIHDLNLPVPESLKEQFDTIIDVGTLEHVFNFPTAIKNCMEMLKVGGHFIGVTITNNFPGHGFYQFSPELYFRIFSSENGFEIKRMLLAVNEPCDYWYEIPDPKNIKRRIIFENSKQSLLLVLSKKISSAEIFKTTPQQSDYEHLAWQGAEHSAGKKKTLFKKVFSFMPDSLKTKMRRNFRILDFDAWHVFLKNTGNGDNNDFKKIKNI